MKSVEFELYKMLGCLRPRTESEIKSKEIDRTIMAITKQFTNAIKILLLGK